MNQLTDIQKYIPDDVFDLIKDERPDIFYLMDLRKDNYIYISPTESLLGYSTRQFYKGGSDFTISLIYPEDHQRVLLHFAGLLENAFRNRTLVKGIKFRMLRKDQQIIWVNRTVVFYMENKKHMVLGLVSETTNEPDKEQFLIGQIGKSPELLKNLANAVEELAEKYEPEKNKICKSITKSELIILRLLSQDLSSKMIASSLGISIYTVENHRKNLHRKLDVHSTGALIGKAGELGLIDHGVFVKK